MKLLNIREVATLLGCSISTIRRRIAAARLGTSTFPLPVHGCRKKGLWRREEIETWKEKQTS